MIVSYSACTVGWKFLGAFSVFLDFEKIDVYLFNSSIVYKIFPVFFYNMMDNISILYVLIIFPFHFSFIRTCAYHHIIDLDINLHIQNKTTLYPKNSYTVQYSIWKPQIYISKFQPYEHVCSTTWKSHNATYP